MVVAANLTQRQRRRLGLVAGLVVLAHGLALHQFARWHASQASLLQPMAQPLYTRVLQPEPPAPPEPVVAVAEPAPPPRPTVRAIPSVPAETTTTLAELQPRVEPPPPEPEPQPEAEALAPEPEPPSLASGPAEPAAPGTDPAEPAASAASAAEPAPPGPAQAAASAPEHPAQPAVVAEPQPAASAPAPSPAAVASAPADPLASWPADTRLRYELGGMLRGGPLSGDARVLWQREGTRYQVRVEVDVQWFGNFTMTSQGEIHPAGLRPQVYEELRRGRPRGLRMGEQEVQLAGGRTAPRPPGVQDTASQFVELTHRFATGREVLEVGRTVSLWLARPGAVDYWTYDIAERELLETRMGPIEAYHLKPRPIANPRGNVTAEMWFAPALRYLPVKIRVRMGEEDYLDLLVEGVDQR